MVDFVTEQQAVRGRGEFLMNTYMHLFGAIGLLVALEFYLFNSGIAQRIAPAMLGVSWLLVLGGFMVVSFIANSVAHNITASKPLQYLAFGLYIVAQSIILVPMLYIAEFKAAGVIENAAIFTLCAFALLTTIVFYFRKDFSFLRPLMVWGGVAAIAAIAISVLFGLHLGMFFTVAMLAYSGGAVLYSTSQVANDYQEGQEVAAAMSLFASIMLLFWYVLQFFMSMGDD